MIVAIIRTRYTNVEEYKEKILQGNGLPTYISNLLKENNFWSHSNSDLQEAYMNLNFQSNETLDSSNDIGEKNELVNGICFSNFFENLNLNKHNKPHSTSNDDHLDVFGNFDDTNQDSGSYSLVFFGRFIFHKYANFFFFISSFVFQKDHRLHETTQWQHSNKRRSRSR